jgi:hypothetical protein
MPVQKRGWNLAGLATNLPDEEFAFGEFGPRKSGGVVESVERPFQFIALYNDKLPGVMSLQLALHSPVSRDLSLKWTTLVQCWCHCRSPSREENTEISDSSPSWTAGLEFFDEVVAVCAADFSQEP